MDTYVCFFLIFLRQKTILYCWFPYFVDFLLLIMVGRKKNSVRVGWEMKKKF